MPVEAFGVDEDGAPQSIETFSAGDLPLALAIGVDRSFSMSADRLAEATSAVQRALGELRADDQVMLLAIGSEVELLTPLSTNHRAAYDALRDLRPWGTTPLFDATIQAIDAIQPAAGRRALILITDGAERYSEIGAETMMSHARTRDVQVYPMVLRRTPSPVLVELAALTGGRSTAVRRPAGAPRRPCRPSRVNCGSSTCSATCRDSRWALAGAGAASA